MTSENFAIASSIELQSEGKLWDLHNSADFQGLQLFPRNNTAIMNWCLRNAPSLPGGCCVSLFFKGLQFVQISARDNDLPRTEDPCVANILKVNPSVRHSDPYMRHVTESSDHFRLEFCFQSGRLIEIGSDVVRVIAVSDENLAEGDLC